MASVIRLASRLNTSRASTWINSLVLICTRRFDYRLEKGFVDWGGKVCCSLHCLLMARELLIGIIGTCPMATTKMILN